MSVRPTLPIREVLRGRRISWVDVVVGAAIIALLYIVVRLGQSLSVNFTPGRTPVVISTDISNVPYYAARSLLRMFIALGLSTVFTLVYGTAAARLRRAEKVLVPILDILQSIPILVFLPIALTFFIKVFPNNLLGLEFASIFVIFTSQAWNMTFSFYHSLISQPTELDEAARMYRLTKWQRFWKLDVPSSMIGLVWNMMMSMGGGWFFLTASEAVTVFVKGRGITESLPGMGSYMAAAIAQGSYTEVSIAIVVMVILVVGTNFFVFRPLVAWSDKFRLESSEGTDKPKSVVLGMLRRSSIPKLAGRLTRPIGRVLERLTRPFGLAEYPLRTDPHKRQVGDVIFWSVIFTASAAVAVARDHLPQRSPRIRPLSESDRIRFGDLCEGGCPAGHLHSHLGAHRGEDRHEPEAVPIRSARCAGSGQFPGHPSLSFCDADLHRPRDSPRLWGDCADDAWRAVVHPLQCHRRGECDSQ